MQNIMFTEPNPAKILSGEKTMTARCWKRKPPKVGVCMTASTGYAKETRFAIIRVTGVYKWNAQMDGTYAQTVIGLTKQEIAEREGFGDTPRPSGSWLTDWDAFIEAYYSINATKFLDDDRQHYFIGFELLQQLNENHDFYCTSCQCTGPEVFLTGHTAIRPFATIAWQHLSQADNAHPAPGIISINPLTKWATLYIVPKRKDNTMKKHFAICDQCIDDVAAFKAEVAANPIAVPMPRPFPLFTSTAEFSMCAVCQRYEKHLPHTVTVDVAKYHEESCDCEPVRPQHNDGGNYHYTTWQPIKPGT